MPLYEYRCRGCGGEFERLVREPSAPLEPCARCGGEDFERLHSLFAVDSAQTRESALASGRRKNAAEQRDKGIADYEEMRHHHQH